MNDVDPLSISENVQARILETVKNITKSFIDAGQEDYRRCSQYAAFIAFTS